MEKEILMGDEAVGLGAIHAGIAAACGYPGTPSTEIFEFIAQRVKKEKLPVHAQWAANEKVGYEEALGVSYAGKRSIVTMKHVGLNVAADAFMNSAITGVNGGLVLAVADDPGMHSSQNEQDSRYYADFAKILCLEPTDQQEAYEMTHKAYELSEKFGLPVMLRLVTRLAHSRSIVKPNQERKEFSKSPSEDAKQWTLLPVNARVRYKDLLDVQSSLHKYANESPYNTLELKSKEVGIIACGIANNYILEHLKTYPKDISYLKINTYPAPKEKIHKLFEHVEKVIIFEEGYPFLETKLTGILPTSYKIHGKLDGTLPEDGELTPMLVHKALGEKVEITTEEQMEIPNRPPALCQGCPHIDIYNSLNDALKDYPEGKVFSDIGCYTLGALPPYNAITTCVDMGASISMAKGASDVGLTPSIAVIGDSTFAHSGMTPLVGAAREHSNINVIILDNATVAMTGGQKTMATGEDLDKIILGLGVEEKHVHHLSPLPKDRETNTKIFKEQFKYNGLSVFVCRRECIQTARKKKKKKDV